MIRKTILMTFFLSISHFANAQAAATAKANADRYCNNTYSTTDLTGPGWELNGQCRDGAAAGIARGVREKKCS